MNSKKIVLVLVYIFIFSCISVYAQGESPEEVAKASMEFVKKSDFSSYARLMHPEALAETKRMFRPIVAADERGKIAERFFGVTNSTQYDALSDIAVFEALMIRITKDTPLFDEVLKTAEFSIIGSVPEGADIAHVVYRSGAKAGGLSISKLEVMSLRRYQGRWRLLLTGDIEGLATMLRGLMDLKK
jgi:hypothetical protein